MGAHGNVNMITLRNRLEIPQVGLGTWQITDRALMAQLIARAYDCGYRLIDTAAAYSNEIALAKAIAAAGIPREEMIITDKVWNTCRGYDNVIEACKRSLKKLKTDYLDLYLVHWPASPKLYPDWEQINADTWGGMEYLYREGLVRAVGVCNFKIHHLEKLRKTASVMPFVNQLEYHPGMMQQEIVDFCHANQIRIMASSPLGSGQILTQETLCELARQRGKSVAQLCLRWATQRGIVVIPKTSNPERLVPNIDIFDFELSDSELKAIDAIEYCGGLGDDSDEVTKFG